jgi:hypothetical protein
MRMRGKPEGCWLQADTTLGQAVSGSFTLATQVSHCWLLIPHADLGYCTTSTFSTPNRALVGRIHTPMLHNHVTTRPS